MGALEKKCLSDQQIDFFLNSYDKKIGFPEGKPKFFQALEKQLLRSFKTGYQP